MSSKNGKNKKKPDNSPDDVGEKISRAERQNKKNMLKFLVANAVAKKYGLPQNCPVQAAQYSFSEPKAGKVTIRRYKRKKATQKGGKKHITHINVSKKTGETQYHVFLKKG